MKKYHKYGVTAYEALVDACTCCFINYNANDPRDSLRKLIEWEIDVALDPTVSKEAQKLIDIGRAQVLAELFEGKLHEDERKNT
jgi:hypothetical protein